MQKQTFRMYTCVRVSFKVCRLFLISAVLFIVMVCVYPLRFAALWQKMLQSCVLTYSMYGCTHVFEAASHSLACWCFMWLSSMHVLVYVCVRTYVFVCVCMYIIIHKYCTYVYCVCMYVYVCMYVCMHACMYMYVHSNFLTGFSA